MSDDKRERMRLHGDEYPQRPAPSVDQQVREWFRKQHSTEPPDSLVRAIGGLTDAQRRARDELSKIPAEVTRERQSLLRAAVKVALMAEAMETKPESAAFRAALDREARRMLEEQAAARAEEVQRQQLAEELPGILAEAKKVFGE